MILWKTPFSIRMESTIPFSTFPSGSSENGLNKSTFGELSTPEKFHGFNTLLARYKVALKKPDAVPSTKFNSSMLHLINDH